MKRPFALILDSNKEISIELARGLSENNFDILLASQEDDIFQIQELLSDSGIEIEAIKVNFSTFGGIENLYQRLKKAGKIPDVLIINTGVNHHKTFLREDLIKEIKAINIDIISVVHLLRRFLPQMIAQRGKVLIITKKTDHTLKKASNAFINALRYSLTKEVKSNDLSILTTQIDEKDNAEAAKLILDRLMKRKRNLPSGNVLSKLHAYALKIIPSKSRTQHH